MTRFQNAALHGLGLTLGSANTVRHHLQGYSTPRPPGYEDPAVAVAHSTSIIDNYERAGDVDWRDKRVLEIGPGTDLTTGAIIRHRGAASYTAVDGFDNRSPERTAALFAELGRNVGAEISEDDLRFVRTQFPDLPDAEGPYDVIVSHATLEHLPEIPALFARLRELAAPGARMVHEVDAMTHMRWVREHDPLNVLRYSETTYRKLLSFPGAPNRLRSGDFTAAATATGWSVVRVTPDTEADPHYLERVRPHLAAPYRNREDLALLCFTMVCDAA